MRNGAFVSLHLKDTTPFHVESTRSGVYAQVCIEFDQSGAAWLKFDTNRDLREFVGRLEYAVRRTLPRPKRHPRTGQFTQTRLHKGSAGPGTLR